MVSKGFSCTKAVRWGTREVHIRHSYDEGKGMVLMVFIASVAMEAMAVVDLARFVLWGFACECVCVLGCVSRSLLS